MIRDPSQIKNSNIWQKAGKSNQGPSSLDKRTVIVLGDQKVGKTSFIKIIKGDFDLQTKPTRLIDYYAMKKQGVQIEFYEVSSPKFQSMLQFYIKDQSCAYTTVILCIDLTSTMDLVSRVNKKIENLRSILKQIVNKKNFNHIKAYNEQRSRFYHYIEKNEDADIIKRMPFNFAIVGCKYDLFQKMPIEQRKWISRCLRYLAHVNQADLFYCSTKNMQICAEIRNVFLQEILGNRSSGFSNQKDHNKPLFILTGEDKISQMSLPSFNNSGAFNQLKILQQQLQSIFPSRKHIQINDQKPKPQFNPINLDSIISNHKKQISNMLSQKKRKKQNLTTNPPQKPQTNFHTTKTHNHTSQKQTKPNSLPSTKHPNQFSNILHKNNNDDLVESHHYQLQQNQKKNRDQEQQYMDENNENGGYDEEDQS